jgi:sulfate adenylyltransferase subunit 2
MSDYNITHLRQLEAESIHIMREVAAEFSNPVMLYSVGKDSSVLLHLARKAFHPAKIPFPLMHVDTGWKFQDMYKFRAAMTEDVGFDLIVHQKSRGSRSGHQPL